MKEAHRPPRRSGERLLAREVGDPNRLQRARIDNDDQPLALKPKLDQALPLTFAVHRHGACASQEELENAGIEGACGPAHEKAAVEGDQDPLTAEPQRACEEGNRVPHKGRACLAYVHAEPVAPSKNQAERPQPRTQEVRQIARQGRPPAGLTLEDRLRQAAAPPPAPGEAGDNELRCGLLARKTLGVRKTEPDRPRGCGCFLGHGHRV